MVGCQAWGTGGCEFPGFHNHVVDVSVLVGYSWTFWLLTERPIGCLKMSGTNYPVTWHQITRTETVFGRLFVLGVFAKFIEKQLLAVCLSNHTHRTQLPLDRCSWNLIFEYFSKICQENSSCLKFWQECKVLYMKTSIHFWSRSVLLRMRNFSQKRKSKHISCSATFFFLNPAVF